jgi:hypothetical protein
MPRLRLSIDALRLWAFLATLVVCVILVMVLIVRIAVHGLTLGATPAIAAVFGVLRVLLALAGIQPPWRR